MKSVSSELKQKIGNGATFYQTARIVFSDGREKELGKADFYMSGNTYSDGPVANSFPLGEAMAKTVTMSLVNDDDRFSEYDFYKAVITAYMKCDLSETTESILLGTYTVIEPESYGTQVSISAIDDMYKGNKDYTTNLVYPATLSEIMIDSCNTCGVPLLSTTFANSSFTVQTKPEGITHRQLWGMIAMIAGGNARMDEYNRLEIVTYDFSYFEQNNNLDGGTFSTETTPYSDGDNADGGNFTDYSSGDGYDGGTFEETNNYHYFYRIKTPTIATDDVVITGIQAEINDTTYLHGEEGYVLKVENQLIEDSPEEALQLIGGLIVGLKFRPFTIDHVAYPLAEFGDLCYVSDRKGNVYQSVVTDMNFTFFGYTTISCSADDPVRNSSKYASSKTEAVIAARKERNDALTARDIALRQLTNLMTQSFGLFKTEEKQEDRSMIYYLHNKPELANSSTIWKMTADAFAVSTDGGQTWNAGLDSEGNAVLNVLSAVGINADWINAGTINGRDINGGTINGATINGSTFNASTSDNKLAIISVKGNRQNTRIYPGEITLFFPDSEGSTTGRFIEISGQGFSGGTYKGNARKYTGIFDLMNGFIQALRVGSSTAISSFTDVYVEEELTVIGDSEFRGDVNATGTVYSQGNVVITNDSYGGIWSMHADTSKLTVNTPYGTYSLAWNSSDSRLKKNIEDTDLKALPVINGIKHRKFEWKEEGRNPVKLGYVARELQKLDEDLVFEVEQQEGAEYESLLQIDETKMIPYITKGMQEMYEIIQRQQAEIDLLKEQVSALTETVNQMIVR